MKSYLKILIGNIILTGAYAFLTVPNNIINGGVTSTSLLISHYLNVDVGIISAILTIFLLLFGLIALGKDFFVRSAFSSICYVVFFNLFHLIGFNIKIPIIICVILAGILVGVGHSLCLLEDSSTVGYDVIALFINKKNNKFNTAIVLRIIGIIVLLVGVLTFGVLSVVYGIIFTLIQTQVIYLMLKKKKKAKKTKRIMK